MALGKTVDIKAYIKSLAYEKSEVYNKTEIDGKEQTLTSSITTLRSDLTTLIGQKANATHTHTKSEITDFDHDHDSDYAALAHTHTGADVLITSEKNLTTKLSEIDTAITGLQTADWDIRIVSELPSTGVSGALYFLGDSDTGSNQYDEYIYDASNERFEKLGSRKIDLSNYVTDVNMELSAAGILSIDISKGSNTPL